MIDYIVKYWVGWALGLISTGIIALLKLSIQQKKESIKRDKLNDHIHMLTLRKMIKDLGEELLAKDHITLEEYDELLELNEPYKALGGNGTAKALINKVECKISASSGYLKK